MASSEDTLFITLVHGTFARSAAWTMPNSNFCRALEANIREFCRDANYPPQVNISRLTWSRWNGLRARRNAAQKLREKLIEEVTEHPLARHFIIAHSHGGNIAMYALRDSELAKRICGLACMATPFLRARLRDSRSGASSIHCAIIVALTWLPLLWLFDWMDVPAIAQVVIAGVFSALVLGPIFSAWQRNARYWMSEMEFPLLGQDQVLILTVKDDEAVEGLTVAHFTFNILDRVFVAMALADTFLKKKLGRAYFPGSRVHPLGIAFVFLSINHYLSPSVAVFAILGVYAASFIATGGWCLPHLPLDISAVKKLPQRNYTDSELSHQGGRNEANPFSLEHSTVYDHPEAFPLISKWICSKLQPLSS